LVEQVKKAYQGAADPYSPSQSTLTEEARKILFGQAARS
jgi:hypothetical protein